MRKRIGLKQVMTIVSRRGASVPAQAAEMADIFGLSAEKIPQLEAFLTKARATASQEELEGVVKYVWQKQLSKLNTKTGKRTKRWAGRTSYWTGWHKRATKRVQGFIDWFQGIVDSLNTSKSNKDSKLNGKKAKFAGKTTRQTGTFNRAQEAANKFRGQ